MVDPIILTVGSKLNLFSPFLSEPTSTYVRTYASVSSMPSDSGFSLSSFFSNYTIHVHLLSFSWRLICLGELDRCHPDPNSLFFFFFPNYMIHVHHNLLSQFFIESNLSVNAQTLGIYNRSDLVL
jgi:hypothetical protein